MQCNYDPTSLITAGTAAAASPTNAATARCTYASPSRLNRSQCCSRRPAQYLCRVGVKLLLESHAANQGASLPGKSGPYPAAHLSASHGEEWRPQPKSRRCTRHSILPEANAPASQAGDPLPSRARATSALARSAGRMCSSMALREGRSVRSSCTVFAANICQARAICFVHLMAFRGQFSNSVLG